MGAAYSRLFAIFLIGALVVITVAATRQQAPPDVPILATSSSPTPAQTSAVAQTTPEPTSIPPTPTPAPSPTPTATPVPVPTQAPTPTPTPGQGGPHLDPRWQKAIKTLDGGTIGRVTADALNIRSAPKLSAAAVGVTYKNHPVTVYDMAEGDAVNGVPVWYQIGEGQFIAAVHVEPFVAPKPKKTFTGHWLDIDLSTYYAIAYDGDTPVHAAIIIAGKERENNRTPEGEFQIFRRVANETMDAATLGFKKTDPDYYYLPNVKWTQYFAPDGVAIHTNYWSDPSLFGTRRSHGCVNLFEKDAYFLWNFVGIGSTIHVHS